MKAPKNSASDDKNIQKPSLALVTPRFVSCPACVSPWLGSIAVPATVSEVSVIARSRFLGGRLERQRRHAEHQDGDTDAEEPPVLEHEAVPDHGKAEREDHREDRRRWHVYAVLAVP